MRAMFTVASVALTLMAAACGQESPRLSESQAVPLARAPAAAVAVPTDAAMTVLLNKYCATCHSTARPAHHVVLDTIAGATASATGALAMLKNQSMPPSRATQPTAAEAASMAAWFKARI